jgi:hypothetical protein
MFGEKEAFGYINLHTKFEQIFDGLYIGGIGGAVPGIF